MEKIYFDDIYERIQDAYSNLFLLAIKKKENLKAIVDSVTDEMNKYLNNIESFVPNGIEGMMFISAVAQKLGCSFFDVLYLTDKDKERIIRQIIDEFDISRISEHAFNERNKYFVYYTSIDNMDGEDIGYELEFECREQSCCIVAEMFEGFYPVFMPDFIYDSVVIWEGDSKDIRQFMLETLVQLGLTIIEDQIDGNEESRIDCKNFFIHSDINNCNHEYIKVMATVPIYKSGKVEAISFEASYCAECGVYYISEDVFHNKILKEGRLLWPVVSINEYNKLKANEWNTSDLRMQSILYILGYNVNGKNNISDDERQTILKYAIELGFVSRRKVIYYLQTFIKKAYPRMGMKKAIEKWKTDLKWVVNCNGDDIIYAVKRIITDLDDQDSLGTNDNGYMSIPDGIYGDLPFK